MVELLVVIAIIAILVLMLLPAISAMRENARRTQCMSKVSQLALGLQSYNLSRGHFPSGVIDPVQAPIISQPQGFHHSWIIQVLPFIEEGTIYRMIDHEKSVYAKENQPVRYIQMEALKCPSSPYGSSGVGTTDYAGVHHDAEAPINSDNRGILFLNSRIARDEITDGAQYTLIIGEKHTPEINTMGWMTGARSSLRNTGTLPNRTGPMATAVQTLSRETIENFDPDGLQESEPWENSDESDAAFDDEFDDEELSDEAESETSESTEDGEFSGDDADAPGEFVNAEEEDEGPIEKVEVTVTQEKISPDDPWAAAKTAGLYVGGFGSHHLGGANFAFADGHIKYITDDIDPAVYKSMGGRNDGQVIDSRLID